MWHKLKGNKGCWGPSKILFADTETAPVTLARDASRTYHVLRCWHLSGGRYREGEIRGRISRAGIDADEFWRLVDAQTMPREVTWLVFHNWGFDCDALLFRDQLQRGRYLLSTGENSPESLASGANRKSKFKGLWVDDGPPGIVSCVTADGRHLKIVDSMNWLPLSLERIAGEIGMHKMPLPAESDSLDAWMQRCQRDTEILERAMLLTINWVREHDLGNLKLTAASQSMAMYRHRCMPCDIIIHDEKPVRALERKSYYGGRVELYYKGVVPRSPYDDMPTSKRSTQHTKPHGPVYELDASGLYVSVMRDGWFPRRLVDWWLPEDESHRTDAPLSDACIADVQLVSNAVPFPLRSEHGVTWACGKMRTTLAGAELGLALKLGVVRKCYGYARYELARLFTEWAQEVWGKRLAAETACPPRPIEARLWKTIGTALHGKFGQRGSAWEILPGHYSDTLWGTWSVSKCSTAAMPGVDGVPDSAVWDESQECWRWWVKYRSLGGQVEQETGRIDSPNTMVAISSFVAAAAREKVRHWMKIAGRYNTLAAHTDALILTMDGLTQLIEAGEVRSRQLGKLRIKAVGDDAELLACGHYRVGNSVCRSGISMRAIELPDGSYYWESFENLSSAVQYAPGPGVLMHGKQCKPTQSYRKGRLIPETGWIEPHVYNQE